MTPLLDGERGPGHVVVCRTIAHLVDAALELRTASSFRSSTTPASTWRSKFLDFQALSRWVGEHVADTEGFRLSRVEWALTKQRHDELAREVRSAAVEDAVTRAQQYADALGLGTGRTGRALRRGHAEDGSTLHRCHARSHVGGAQCARRRIRARGHRGRRPRSTPASSATGARASGRRRRLRRPPE